MMTLSTLDWQEVINTYAYLDFLASFFSALFSFAVLAGSFLVFFCEFLPFAMIATLVYLL